MTITDYADYNTPQEHANKIAVTGAPLLTLQRAADSQSGTLIPAGGTYTSPVIAVTQPAYDFAISLIIAAGSNVPWVRVNLAWTDTTTSSSPFITDTFYLAVQNGVTGTFGGRGISKGNQLQVTITNLDNVATVTMSYGVSQMSRVPLRDDIRSITFAGAVGFGTAYSDLRSGIMSLGSLFINAGADSDVLLPLFTGRVILSVINPPQTCNFRLRAVGEQADPANVVANPEFYYSGVLAVNQPLVNEVAMPRSNVVMRVHNGSGVNATFNWGMIMTEY